LLIPGIKILKDKIRKKNQLKKLKNKAPTKRSEVVSIMQAEPNGK